jgi:hypothetical protein
MAETAALSGKVLAKDRCCFGILPEVSSLAPQSPAFAAAIPERDEEECGVDKAAPPLAFG